MRIVKLCLVTLSLAAGTVVMGYQFNDGRRSSVFADADSESLATLKTNELGTNFSANVKVTQRYVLDGSQSKFIARAFAGGLLWFKGKDHLIAVRDFTGEAQLTPDSINPASLEITAKAGSMVETRDVFTDQEKQIINKELREIVLQPDKYPDIIFKSTSVNGESTAANQYDLKIIGDLTLHGVTRPITIPTQITVTGDDLGREVNSRLIGTTSRSKLLQPCTDWSEFGKE